MSRAPVTDIARSAPRRERLRCGAGAGLALLAQSRAAVCLKAAGEWDKRRYRKDSHLVGLAYWARLLFSRSPVAFETSRWPLSVVHTSAPPATTTTPYSMTMSQSGTRHLAPYWAQSQTR